MRRNETVLRCLITFAFALLLGSAAAVEAQIGETEIRLAEQFGAVQSRLPERMLDQGAVHVLGERIVMKRAGWRVTAVLIDGRCAKITYAKTGAWTEQHYQDLLRANVGRWTWHEVTSGAPKWQRTWRRSDGLVAKWMYAGGFAIEGQPFVDARERIQKAGSRVPAATASR